MAPQVGTICRAFGNILVAVAGSVAPSEQGMDPARLQNAIVTPLLVVAIASMGAVAAVWGSLGDGAR